LVIVASTGPSSSLFLRASSHSGSFRKAPNFCSRSGQRFPLQNQEQIIARLSNRYSPEPELFDSMFFEQPQRIGLKPSQQSRKTTGNAMKHS
jgi:hypothetical protein